MSNPLMQAVGDCFRELGSLGQKSIDAYKQECARLQADNEQLRKPDFPALFRDPRQCVEALEALKGLVVLGPWGRFDSVDSYRRSSVRPTSGVAVLVSWFIAGQDPKRWHVTVVGMPEVRDFHSEIFDTPEAAQAAADNALAGLPNVRLVGVIEEGKPWTT